MSDCIWRPIYLEWMW